MPLTSNTYLLPSGTAILVDGAAPDISCYWCRKVAAICDGNRTLQDVAELLYLPLPVMQKLAQKALDHGWLALVGAPSQEAARFWQEVSGAVGQEHQDLLDMAARMTRQQPGNVSSGTIANFLIALELLLSEEQRGLLIPKLDSIRQRYGLN